MADENERMEAIDIHSLITASEVPTQKGRAVKLLLCLAAVHAA